jgi:hypothetical protein
MLICIRIGEGAVGVPIAARMVWHFVFWANGGREEAGRSDESLSLCGETPFL